MIIFLFCSEVLILIVVMTNSCLSAILVKMGTFSDGETSLGTHRCPSPAGRDAQCTVGITPERETPACLGKAWSSRRIFCGAERCGDGITCRRERKGLKLQKEA